MGDHNLISFYKSSQEDFSAAIVEPVKLKLLYYTYHTIILDDSVLYDNWRCAFQVSGN